jgi:hypothetical protein
MRIIKPLKYNRALGMKSIENKYIMLYAQQHVILSRMDLRLKIATTILRENGFDHWQMGCVNERETTSI